MEDTNALEELEEAAFARRAIDQLTRMTAEVVVDLETKGALHHFLADQFEKASDALLTLATVSPTDTAGIYELQLQIRPYLAACHFIRSAIEQGEETDQAIEEMHGNVENANYPD